MKIQQLVFTTNDYRTLHYTTSRGSTIFIHQSSNRLWHWTYIPKRTDQLIPTKLTSAIYYKKGGHKDITSCLTHFCRISTLIFGKLYVYRIIEHNREPQREPESIGND